MNAWLALQHRRCRRRGVVAVQVLILSTVLFGFVALTVDLGRLFRARAELQNAADAAALAGASALASDAMQRTRSGFGTQHAWSDTLTLLTTRAKNLARRNFTLGSPTLLNDRDIVTGWLDVTSGTSIIDAIAPPTSHNAVQIVVRREGAGGEASNGSVPYFFGPLLGKVAGETRALAVAAYDDRFLGYQVGAGGSSLLPLSVHEDAFTGGGVDGGVETRDVLTFDDRTDSIRAVQDGIPEIKILDFKPVPGNYGWLNLAAGYVGTSALVNQVTHGVSPEDAEAVFGTSELVFYDEYGNPVNYSAGSTPAGDDPVLVDTVIEPVPGRHTKANAGLGDRISDVVGIFVHDQVVENGRNAEYRVTGIRFVRIMASIQTGARRDQGTWVQLASYSGNDVRVSSAAPSSDGLVGRVKLVR